MMPSKSCPKVNLCDRIHAENKTTKPTTNNKLMDFRYSTENTSVRINSLILGANY